MGQIKQALIEAECNAHAHPLFADILNKFAETQAQPDTTTIYGVYANGILLSLYQRKDTAEYECWISRMGEEITMPETPTHYDVRPLTMHTHRPD
jgi:hypothetical protein